MRYWYNEDSERAYALDVEPPDMQGTFEISLDDYREILAAQPAAELAPPAPAKKPVTMADLARAWRQWDEDIDALKAECEAKVREIKVKQEQVEAVLLGQMNSMKADKLTTEFGVINRKEETHANAADWGAIWRFIVENNKFEMVQKRLTTTEVLKYAKAHATKDEQGREVLALPPGISLFSKYKISVSKPTGRKALPTDEGAN